MRATRLIFLLAALAVPAAAGPAPTAHVEAVPAGDGSTCVTLRLSLPGQARPDVLPDVCHGWSSFDCGGALFVDVHPVVQAQGVVLLPRERVKIDLTERIDQEIARRWPGDELNHLTFARPSCVGGKLSVAFDASRAPAAGGPGHGLAGVITVASGRAVTHDLRPTPP